MGKYSYSLYISHFPIVFIFSKVMHNIWGYVFFCLPVVFVIAYSLETWLQPAVVRYFRKNESNCVRYRGPFRVIIKGPFRLICSPYGRPEIIV